MAIRIIAVVGLAVAASVAPARGAVLAYDDSDDPAYDDAFPQWDSGDNGGYGFTAWTLSPASPQGDSGFFTATSSQNGFAPSGDIDSPDGDAWGLYANGTGSAEAYRGFDFNGDSTLDSMPLYSTFTLYMDNGWNDANVGFVLRTGNDTGGKNTGQRLEFLHTAGENYRIIDSSGAVDTGIGWTDGGLILSLTLTSENTYSLLITPAGGGSSSVFSGTLGGSGGIQSVALYNEHAGNGSNFDVFFNNMTISDAVPEPGVVSLLVLSTAFLAGRRRRQRQTRTLYSNWDVPERRAAIQLWREQ